MSLLRMLLNFLGFHSNEEPNEESSDESPRAMNIISNPPNATHDILLLTTPTSTTPYETATHLAHSLPTARILLYTYNTSLTVQSISKNLTFAISDQRFDSRARPLIWIAFGTGDMACKDALVRCSVNDGKLGRVLSATRGVVFCKEEEVERRGMRVFLRSLEEMRWVVGEGVEGLARKREGFGVVRVDEGGERENFEGGRAVYG
ncbi:hypothetical protein GLAREA_10364 [Glarea lozoyensis ATCC 20868]|uniref:Uncharacterized protein n=1 Tax=Glarea lozoyensis (strain ATCC 20868 / MF5171) TaxID=1116229 RepID=S3DAB4_GLAL2|nr:uncharacterized protein GLAREA_10364 [Glarea lozoyensis ATCC 20868]EPE34670.1 hypothetical protein GLAREA_10364 [Glarea lozoyensis ATCC 20868]